MFQEVRHTTMMPNILLNPFKVEVIPNGKWFLVAFGPFLMALLCQFIRIAKKCDCQ